MRPRFDRDHPARAVRRVAHNTLYLTIADAAGKLLMFVFFVVAARHLGAERFGVLSFSLAYVAMFAVFADLGLGAIAAREIARDACVAQRYINNALTIKLLASLLLVAAVSLTVRLLGYPPQTVEITVICSWFIIFSAVALYYNYVFQGFERTVFAAVSRVLQTVILVLGAFLLTRVAPSVAGYARLYVVAGGVGGVSAWLIATIVFVRPGLGFDLPLWVRLLRQALPIGIAAAFSMLYYWNGSALLSRVGGDLAVGLYNAPFRMVMGLGFLAQGFSGAVYPVMSRLHVTDRERLREVFSRSFRYITMLSVGFVVLGSFLGRSVLILLYGQQYSGSAPIMAVLAWWGGFICLNSFLSYSLYAIDRPRAVTRQTALALALNLGLNLVLVFRYGAVGIAVAIVVAEGVGAAYLLVIASRSAMQWNWQTGLRSLPRMLAAAGLAGAAGLLAARWNVPAGIALGVAGYPLLLLGLRAINGEDVRLARLVLSRSDER